MYYGAGDNDLEPYLLSDVEEMKKGFVDGQGVNFILLFDRLGDSRYFGGSYRQVFGEDFTGARLYSLTSGKTHRLYGEAEFPEMTETPDGNVINTGDPETLRKFIRFCKVNFPARKYALIMSNHGGGPKKKSSLPDTEPLYKEICQDKTNDTGSDDYLYTHEISSLTSDESVDILGIDACFMSSVEFAYQFRKDDTNSRFSAEILVASAPQTWASGWDYMGILNRMLNGAGMSQALGGGLSSMTAKDFSLNMLRYSGFMMTQMSCLDLTKVSTVKEAVDDLAKELPLYKTQIESIRGSVSSPNILHYFDALNADERYYYPFFDLYALAEEIYNFPLFKNTPIEVAAYDLMNAVEDFVIDSFVNPEVMYDLFKTGFVPGINYPFQSGKNGVHIFFPAGDTWSAHKTWYNGDYIYNGNGEFICFRLDWCAASGGVVKNWFELLDFWY